MSTWTWRRQLKKSHNSKSGRHGESPSTRPTNKYEDFFDFDDADLCKLLLCMLFEFVLFQVLLTDREYDEVVIYKPDGDFISSFGGKGKRPGLFNRPTGIAYDALYDRVFVADKNNHRLQVFTPVGGFIGRLGKCGKMAGQFSYPWGVALNKNGLILVADSRNHRLQLFSPNGQFMRMFQPGFPFPFNFPRGVAFSNNGKSLPLYCVGQFFKLIFFFR